MKKLNYFFLLSSIVLLAVGCAKDDENNSSEMKTFDTFIIEPPAFTSDTKSYLDYTASLSRILYEDNDIVYVNGEMFELTQEGDHWEATGTKVSSDYFHFCHASGSVSNFSTPTYHVNFADNSGTLSSTNGIVLYGKTNNNVLTLTPAFAVLVFAPAEMSNYTGVKVGFEGSIIPRSFDISAADGSFSNLTDYLPSASSSVPQYTMLSMKKDPGNNYFYIAIPIPNSSVSTKLYFLYNTTSGDVQRVTSGSVTLQKGKVYVIPSEDMEDYPFDENGCGKSLFSVSGSKHVYFSAGNLRCNPALYTANTGKVWVISSNQYDQLSNANNQDITSTSNRYIDIFGWATSGREQDNGFTHHPYLTTDVNSDYYAGSENGDLSGTFYDWGNWASRGRFFYGEHQTTINPSNRWRTLTNDEWEYLLNSRANATSLRGFAIINGVRGMVLLPDSWTLPTGITFNANGPINTYTVQQWAKMEKKGAIFLPACGMRSDASTVDGWNIEGYYWTGTHRNMSQAYVLYFKNNGSTTSFEVSMSIQKHNGASVRLVLYAD